jgi:hypothetical protein
MKKGTQRYNNKVKCIFFYIWRGSEDSVSDGVMMIGNSKQEAVMRAVLVFRLDESSGSKIDRRHGQTAEA